MTIVSPCEPRQYNWGYDPKNYNVPEGSYSTNPYDGAVRIREMKQMIKAFHENGIRVNMDVVYNHTFDIENSWFQKTVPDYYYRRNKKGYSNASGCGNETASDRLMFRKYMVDSVTYLANEYHIDGFRFDLMAVHDLDTMYAIRKALDKMTHQSCYTARDGQRIAQQYHTMSRRQSQISDRYRQWVHLAMI
jgi:pullulanase